MEMGINHIVGEGKDHIKRPTDHVTKGTEHITKRIDLIIIQDPTEVAPAVKMARDSEEKITEEETGVKTS